MSSRDVLAACAMSLTGIVGALWLSGGAWAATAGAGALVWAHLLTLAVGLRAPGPLSAAGLAMRAPVTLALGWICASMFGIVPTILAVAVVPLGASVAATVAWVWSMEARQVARGFGRAPC